MTEQVLINVDVKGSNAIPEVEKGIASIEKTTKKTTNALVDLKNEMKAAKAAMLSAEEGSKAYNQAMARAAAASFKMKDANDKIKASVLDVGQTAVNAGKAVAGIAGGFAVAQGAIALFGIENEATAKAILKVQAALSIATGLAQFADSIEGIKDLMEGLRAASNMSNIAAESAAGMNELASATDEAADSTKNLAKESSIMASNVAGATNLVKENKKAIKELTEEQRTLLDLDKLNIKPIDDKSKALLEQAKAANASTSATSKAVETTKKVASAASGFVKGIGSMVLTMGAFAIAIGAIIYGITKLVEYLNKVPKDLEINIALNEDALKGTEKARVLIKEIQNDLDVISKMQGKQYTTKLAQIKEVIVQNNIATQNEIKDLSAKELRESKYFQRYLQKVTDTAYNEAVIKKRVEADVEMEIAIQQRKAILSSIKEKLKSVNKFTNQNADEFLAEWQSGNMSTFKTVSFGLTGVSEKWNDVNDQIKESVAASKTLSRIKLRTVLSDLVSAPPKAGATTTKGIKTTDTTLPFQYREIESLQLKSYNIRLKAAKAYTNEEYEIINQANKRKNDSARQGEVRELESQRRLLEARKRDLLNQLSESLAIKRKVEGESSTVLSENKKQQQSYIDKDLQLKKQLQGYQKSLFDQERTTKKFTDLQSAAAQKGNKADEKKYAGLVTNSKFDEEAYKKQIERLNGSNGAIKKNSEALDLINKKTEETINSFGSEYPEAIDNIKSAEIELIKTDDELVQSGQLLYEARRNQTQAYVDALGDLTTAVADAFGTELDLVQQARDRKIEAYKQSTEYAIMSEEDRAKGIYAIQLDSYEKEKKIFEQKKLAEEAAAIVNYASGVVSIISSASELGPIAGPIVGALQVAALTATTAMSIKSIRAQQLDKPVLDSSLGSAAGSSSSGTGNIALNPTRTALTSKEENINQMRNSSNVNQTPIIVKVSDINNVQGNVKVRDNNQSY